MTPTLKDRLVASRDRLSSLEQALAKAIPEAPTAFRDDYRNVLVFHRETEHWLDLMETRHIAMTQLQKIETLSSIDEEVAFGTSTIPFRQFRFLLVQGHLATTWALSDSIGSFCGRVFFPLKSAKNPKETQFCQNFVGNSRGPKLPAIFETLRQSYGWAIGVSYAIRNHFCHDGGQLAGQSFFDDQNPRSPFAISEQGWKHVENKLCEYLLDSDTWDAFEKLEDPRNDLRNLLQLCEVQMDRALGVLVGSSCALIEAQAAHVLEQR